MKKGMENSRNKILRYFDPGLLTNYPKFYEQFEEFGDRLEAMDRNPILAIAVWLQCGR